MRRCTRCPYEGPDENFGVRIKSKANDTGVCKPCKKTYNASWYTRNKRDHVSNVRRNMKGYQARAREILRRVKNTPCKDCHHKYPHYVMQFDHVRGEKFRNVNEGMGLLQLIAEIDKCDVVCANCHATRTYYRRMATASDIVNAIREESN